MSREERTTSDARAAPTIPSTPRAFVLDGDIQEWRDHPPFVTLHKTTPDAREGLLWLGQAENGVVLAGQIFGDPPRWPPAPDMMARGDHIEVWLADPSGFEIVPLSWGNSRQWVGLTTEDDCSEVPDAARCKAWFRAHARAGQAVDRLFVRQWQLSPDHAVEAFADPAFQSLPAAAKRDLEPLRPSASPLAKFQGASTPDYAYMTSATTS